MRKAYHKLLGWLDDPTLLRKFNGWSTIIWFLLAIPICIFLSDSVPFIVFISVYAVVTGHLSSWQAARVEEKQKKQEDEEEKKNEERENRLVERIDSITPDK